MTVATDTLIDQIEKINDLEALRELQTSVARQKKAVFTALREDALWAQNHQGLAMGTIYKIRKVFNTLEEAKQKLSNSWWEVADEWWIAEGYLDRAEEQVNALLQDKIPVSSFYVEDLSYQRYSIRDAQEAIAYFRAGVEQRFEWENKSERYGMI